MFFSFFLIVFFILLACFEPWASLSSSADLNLRVLKNVYNNTILVFLSMFRSKWALNDSVARATSRYSSPQTGANAVARGSGRLCGAAGPASAHNFF